MKNYEVYGENQKSISQWAEETFGPAGVNARMNDEVAELLSKLTSDDNHPDAGEEMADILIVLYRLADRMGYNLREEVNRKMAINRRREWVLDGTGHAHHA